MSQESTSGSGLSADDILKKFAVPEFLKKGRNNPINGKECFFSESTFRRVVGPEPCLRERFHIQLARARDEQNVKPAGKKKRRKDFDLPSQKESSPISLIPKSKENSALSKTERPDKLTEIVSPDDSTEDDEISTNLVIADDEEQDQGLNLLKVLPPAKEPFKSGASIHSDENSKDKESDQDSIRSKAWQPDCVSYKGDIPLYATGITSQQKTFFPPPISKDGDALKEEFCVTNKNSALKEECDQSTESVWEPEEGVCLVLPPLDTNSDNDNDNSVNKTEPILPSTSSLPLIPALMLEPVKGHKVERSVHSEEDNLSKLDMAPKFYSSDQAETAAKPESQHSRPDIPIKTLTHAKKDDSKADDMDVDVPIFSVANSSDDLSREIGSKRSLRNKGIWSTEQQSMEKKPSQKSVAKNNTVKEAMEFKQSDLTRQDMATYLNLFGKYVQPYLYGSCRPMFTQQQKDEMAQFEILQERVHREQREFQAYLQQNAVRNPQFYNFIKKHMKHYAFTKAQAYRPRKTLVHKFNDKLTAKIPLQADLEQVELIFQQHLLEIGSPPKIILPDVKSGNNPVPIPHDMRKLEVNFPISGGLKNADVLHHESVSEDTNAQTLAIKYDADFVMSSSVVKCLLDNRGPGFSRTWNVPIAVREHQTKGSIKKVVYLNKPIFEGNLLLRDYNALFHKYALRVMVSHPKHTISQYLRQQQKQFRSEFGKKKAGTRPVDDPFDMFATDLEALETFGKGLGSTDGLSEAPKDSNSEDDVKNCRRSKRLGETSLGKESLGQVDKALTSFENSEEQCGKQNNSANLGDRSEHLAGQKAGRLRKRPLNPRSSTPHKGKCAEMETQDSPAKKAKENAALSEQCKADSMVSSSSSIKSSLVSQTKCQVTTASSAEQYRQCFQPQMSSSGDASVSSNLLDLILGPDITSGEKQEVASQENPSDYTPHSEVMSSLVYNQWTLGKNKILIRTRSQGVLKTQNVYLTTKMEYQTSHGLEQVTAEEMVRDWAACYIRPNTKLLRARINAFTSEILAYEELETHQIRSSASSFKPDKRFSFLNNLLKHLSSLKQGHYLVSHEAGSDYCGIRVQKSGARLDDLDEKLLAVPQENKFAGGPVPWIPIDPNLLLPHHVLNKRIPATFLPKDVFVANVGAKKPQKVSNATNQGSKKKKKKKKKFSKKNNMERDFF